MVILIRFWVRRSKLFMDCVRDPEKRWIGRSLSIPTAEHDSFTKSNRILGEKQLQAYKKVGR